MRIFVPSRIFRLKNLTQARKLISFDFHLRIGTVDLARNQLTKVEFQMFADLRFIDTIDLAENQISEVQREAFKNIYLTKINMSHNFIEDMGEDVFRNCDNMTVMPILLSLTSGCAIKVQS